MSTRGDNEAAKARVERIIAYESGRPFARERATAYRALVEYDPRMHCAPNDEELANVAAALDAYAAKRPDDGFVNSREQARAHVDAARGRVCRGCYIDEAITAYEHALRGESKAGKRAPR